MGDKPEVTEQSRIHIEDVGVDSPLLFGVIKLHAAGKSKLGPFPQGAFEDHARQKWILAAIAGDGSVAGYLLFRITRRANRASIVHLTTSEQFRRRGVARQLVDRLKERTRHLLGISLRCRRDYNIAEVWQSFGFTVRNSKQGRGADGAILDYWWFDHNHDDLWSHAAAREDQAERVATVIDANVFFDLTAPGRPHAEDSQVLEADWLQDSVQLYVTPEIFNEIQRSAKEEEKARGRQNVNRFLLVKTDDALVRALEPELTPHFRGAILANDVSDMRQIAHAIVAGVPFFVTRDKPMLERSDFIYDRYGLSILHPTDLINRCDVLRREAEYRPSRLQGSTWREQLLLAENVGTIVGLFHQCTSEKRGSFEQQVRRFLAQPDHWVSRIVSDSSQTPVLYVVQSAKKQGDIEIPVIRHANHALTGTLLRHVLHETARGTDLGPGGQKVITVKDPGLSQETVEALTELGFVPDSSEWWKISISGLATRNELISSIQKAKIPLSLRERLVGAVTVAEYGDCEASEMRLEHLFHPVKLAPSRLPCYIVSIRPSWAEHFFDVATGGQTRMDLNERLHLGIEGVYYCSAQNKHLVAPGRILWYVSGRRAMCVKACSHLEERFIDLPKQLYSRFRHLGVYTWKHVIETVDGKVDAPLMAFRFSKTERFMRPVALEQLKNLEIAQPQNPRHISAEQFSAIYSIGMGL